MSVIVSVENVNKAFSGKNILNNISLEVYEGEFLTLLGASGCGKTTLLRLLAGFDIQDSGVIKIANQDVHAISAQKRRVNTVFQSHALFPHLTVYDNVAFGLRCKGYDKQQIHERVIDTLNIVQMQEHQHHKPHQISGGQQQRTAIARAIINEPLVLLLDESLSALDYRLRKSMQLELKQLQRKLGMTFIFITHDQEEALSMSDRVAYISQGRVEQIGTPRELYEQPQNLKVAEFIGDVNIFDCEVIDSNRQQITIKVENAEVSLPCTAQYAPGDRIHLLIRPEDYRVWGIGETTQAENMMPGNVREIIYKGCTVELVVELNSGKLIHATEFFDEDDEDLEYKINEQVMVHWLPGWEVILPYEK